MLLGVRANAACALSVSTSVSVPCVFVRFESAIDLCERDIVPISVVCMTFSV